MVLSGVGSWEKGESDLLQENLSKRLLQCQRPLGKVLNGQERRDLVARHGLSGQVLLTTRPVSHVHALLLLRSGRHEQFTGTFEPVGAFEAF